MFKFTFTSSEISAAETYTQHQKIWEIFSASTKICYRIDDDRITVSTDKPPVLNITCTSSIVPAIQVGECVQFKLRANVIVKRDGKRRAIRDPQGISQWLTSQALKYGFKIVSLSEVSNSRPVIFHKAKQIDPITLNVVDFVGTLEVVDRELFLQACENGIGKKEFGVGLLDIATVSVPI